MSIQTYLENMRSKSDHEKKRFAFWSSFSFTFLLFAFWVASFTASVSTSQSSVAQALEKTSSPAQSLVASVGSFFGDVVSYFTTPKVIEYKDIEVVSGK